MKVRKGTQKTERINLDLLYPATPANLPNSNLEKNNDYDPTDDFTLEELEEMGAIEIPKATKVIQDGESAFYSAIKNGEDW